MSDTTVGADDNCPFVPCVLASPLAYEQLQDGGKGDETKSGILCHLDYLAGMLLEKTEHNNDLRTK